jgi:hypothetical protein
MKPITSIDMTNTYMTTLTDGGKSLTLSIFHRHHYSHIPKMAFFIALQGAGLLEHRKRGMYKIHNDPYEVFVRRNSTVGVALDKVNYFQAVYGTHIDTAARIYEIMKIEAKEK